MAKPRLNFYAIRRIVESMSIHSTEDEIRAKVQANCVPLSSAEFVQRCQETGVRYFRRMTEGVRRG